jgi:acyl-CoA thioester hydrolase
VQQQALRDATGAIFVVSETSVRYRAPARLDDELLLTVAPQAATGARLQVQQQAWRGSTLLADGSIRVACVDASTFKPRRLPDAVRSALLAGAAAPAAWA